MKNIGEKLEQARNSRGLSLKDAVTYTKIKQEFLMAMEKNDFSFNLPDVYRRGFLRLYADYLKLDSEEIMQDYKLMQGEIKKASSAKLLDKIAANDNMLSNEALNNVVEADIVDTSERFDADKDYFDAPPSPLECDSKLNYLRIALIGSSILLGILIIFFLFKAMLSGSDSSNLSNNAVDSSSVPASSFLLTLEAKPNLETYIVLFYEGEENNPIYAGALNAGESKDFEIRSSGALLNVSDVERLLLYKNAAQANIPPTLKGPKILNITAP